MKKTLLSFAIIAAFAGNAFALADTVSSAAGGAGGAGGQASGGAATGGSGGAATVTGTGTSNASGGASSASTGNTSVGVDANVSVGGSSTDVNINYNSSDHQTLDTYGKYTSDSTSKNESIISGKQTLDVNQTNSGTVTNRVEYSGTQTIKNTPDVNVAGPASGPCNGFSATAGFSIPGFGLAGGVSEVDAGCARRETARIAGMLGRMDLANAILESDPIVVAALKSKTETQSKEAEAAQMKEQQKVAAVFLERKRIMNNAGDTLHFTGAQTQADEKTEQQVMAEKHVYTDPIIRARLGLPPL